MSTRTRRINSGPEMSFRLPKLYAAHQVCDMSIVYSSMMNGRAGA